MKALTEILALFLNSSKGSETIAQGFGVNEQKLRPFMELCMSSWTNQQEQTSLIIQELKLSKADKRVLEDMVQFYRGNFVKINRMIQFSKSLNLDNALHPTFGERL